MCIKTNFEGNFEIRCSISIFVRSMNASEPKMLSFIGVRPSVHFGLGPKCPECGRPNAPSRFYI